MRTGFFGGPGKGGGGRTPGISGGGLIPWDSPSGGTGMAGTICGGTDR